MQVTEELKTVLDDVLSLGGRARGFGPGTPLLGASPELDSMAVVSLITALEERFGIEIADDEIDGAVFATFGSLAGFVERMQAR
jgi:acyl carrier protein